MKIKQEIIEAKYVIEDLTRDEFMVLRQGLTDTVKKIFTHQLESCDPHFAQREKQEAQDLLDKFSKA